ncbi:MAG: sigma-70 family RNA polymerase sigma factor [Leptolyngbyaceae cyanobacterium CSU_1_3]|nr:sigma-70 family RNA polymerase sigma factor [Leptolyngbyaceae cyanobacterium CSU_1_3]
MRPRQNVSDIFSTFLQWAGDAFGGWAIDTRLRRSMQSCLDRVADANVENFWALYWHRCWQEGQPSTLKTLAEGHLSAYLQESCYWSAQKTIARLTNSQFSQSDCFQAAIVEVPKILKACNPDQRASLKTYANTAFGNIIRDYLRQRREIDFCNDWGLLLKLSRKRLIESLEHAGMNAETIDSYVAAWTCFTAIYIPTKSPGLRQSSPPDRDTWNTIATLYNRKNPSATPETLERWLIFCAHRSRAYLYPAVTSLNLPKSLEQSGERQDDLSDPAPDLLTELIAQEEAHDRQTQQDQINTILVESLDRLDPSAQELLSLYYRSGLTQQQIAQRLNIPQYTVSRRLSKARETLLLALTRWSQETLHISPTSNVVKHISTVLEEWLERHLKNS